MRFVLSVWPAGRCWMSTSAAPVHSTQVLKRYSSTKTAQQLDLSNDNNNSSSDSDVAWLPQDPHFATIAIHAGYSSKGHAHGSVVPPIALATTFVQEEPGVHQGYSYSRADNPTRNVLEKALATLEKSKYAFTYSSGQSAALNAISLLKPGENVIAPDSMYDGTSFILKQAVVSMGISVDYVDMTNLDELKMALKPNTKLVWLETPANPTMKVYDIQAASEIVRNYSKDVILAVDNTFLTPFFQKPLGLGADLSVYSLTKYIGGHSDVLMGGIMVDRDDLKDKLQDLQKTYGTVPSPFECYLVLRSIKTLSVRMPVHMSNGLKVAKFLQSHPRVEKVMHPGLPSHPTHHLALKQSSGHSGMVSMIIKDSATSTAGPGNEKPDLESAIRFAQNLRLIKLAESLGGSGSTLKIPSSMNFAPVERTSESFTDEIVPPTKITMEKPVVPPPVETFDQKRSLELTSNFVRLSIGLESAEDIIEDLNQALNKC